MDRSYIKQFQKLTLFSLSLKIFREEVIYNVNIRERLQQVLLDTILLERQGNVIDRHVIKNILSMFQDVSVEDPVTKYRNNNVYEEEFEDPFLKATKEFYRVESQSFLEQVFSSFIAIIIK